MGKTPECQISLQLVLRQCIILYKMKVVSGPVLTSDMGYLDVRRKHLVSLVSTVKSNYWSLEFWGREGVISATDTGERSRVFVAENQSCGDTKE